MGDSERLDFKEFDATSDIEPLLELFKRCFNDSKLDYEYINWLYAENPDGPVVAFNAWSNDGRLVGHYALVPRNFIPGGNFLLSVNTATHPEFGRRGIFGQLASLCYARGAELGFSGVVGVANSNSIYTFTNKLGFQLLGYLKLSLVRTSRDITSEGVTMTSEQLSWRLRNPKRSYSLHPSDGACFEITTKLKAFTVWLGRVSGSQEFDLGSVSRKEWLPVLAPIFHEVSGEKANADWSIPISSKLTGSEWNFIYKDLSNGRVQFNQFKEFCGLMMDTF